jgi:hypothetical protein
MTEADARRAALMEAAAHFRTLGDAGSYRHSVGEVCQVLEDLASGSTRLGVTAEEQKEAARAEVRRIVAAARSLVECANEFGDDDEALSEQLVALEAAVDREPCPKPGGGPPVRRAVQCDACGKLVSPRKAIRLALDILKQDSESLYESWSDLDICRECWTRPLGEVLQAAAEGACLTSEALPSQALHSHSCGWRGYNPGPQCPECLELGVVEVDHGA